MTTKRQSKELPILFESPTEMIVGKERNSKLLSRQSELVKFLEPIRSYCLSLPFQCDARPWHIELSHGRRKEASTETKPGTSVLDRAQYLHGKPVDVGSIDNFGVMSGKALVFWTPSVEGYGHTHTTIGYFRNRLPDNIWKEIFDYIKGLITSM